MKRTHTLINLGTCLAIFIILVNCLIIMPKTGCLKKRLTPNIKVYNQLFQVLTSFLTYLLFRYLTQSSEELVSAMMLQTTPLSVHTKISWLVSFSNLY